jgi:hypothetical protein
VRAPGARTCTIAGGINPDDRLAPCMYYVRVQVATQFIGIMLMLDFYMAKEARAANETYDPPQRRAMSYIVTIINIGMPVWQVRISTANVFAHAT